MTYVFENLKEKLIYTKNNEICFSVWEILISSDSTITVYEIKDYAMIRYYRDI